MKTSTSASRPLRRGWMLLGGAACFLAVTPPAFARPPQSPADKIETAANRVGNFFFRAARKLETPVTNGEVRTTRTQRIYTVRTTPDDDIELEIQRSRPRPQRGTENPATRVWDPVTQQWLPPGMVPQRHAYSSGGAVYSPGGGVTVRTTPSMPAVRLQPRPGGSPPVITDLDVNAMRQTSETRYLDPYGPEEPEVNGATFPREETLRENVPAFSGRQETASEAAIKTAAAKPAAPQAPTEYGTRVPGKPGFAYPPGVERETKNMLDVRGLASGQKVRDPRSGQIFLVP